MDPSSTLDYLISRSNGNTLYYSWDLYPPLPFLKEVILGGFQVICEQGPFLIMKGNYLLKIYAQVGKGITEAGEGNGCGDSWPIEYWTHEESFPRYPYSSKMGKGHGTGSHGLEPIYVPQIYRI